MKLFSQNRLSWGILSLIFVAALTCGVPAAHAAVSVEGRTGVISITSGGTVTVVQPGDALPAIPDGATVEVVTGTADISVTGDTKVMVKINNAVATLEAGASVSVSVETATGNASMKVTAGEVQVTDGLTPQTVKAGNTVKAMAVPPTAINQLSFNVSPTQGTGRQQAIEEGIVTGY